MSATKLLLLITEIRFEISQVRLRSGNITSRVNQCIFTKTGIRISSLEIMLGDNIYLKASVQRLY